MGREREREPRKGGTRRQGEAEDYHIRGKHRAQKLPPITRKPSAPLPVSQLCQDSVHTPSALSPQHNVPTIYDTG